MRLTLPVRRSASATLAGAGPADGHGFPFLPRMVPVMRRRIAILSVLGLLGAGLGCQHIGGKCDCQAHPSDAVLPGPSNPYPTAPVVGTTVPPPPIKAPGMEVAPDTAPLLAPR